MLQASFSLFFFFHPNWKSFKIFFLITSPWDLVKPNVLLESVSLVPCYCQASCHNLDKYVLRWAAILLVIYSPRNLSSGSIISNKSKSIKWIDVGKKNNLGETNKKHLSQKVSYGMIIFLNVTTFAVLSSIPSLSLNSRQALPLICLLQT